MAPTLAIAWHASFPTACTAVAAATPTCPVRPQRATTENVIEDLRSEGGQVLSVSLYKVNNKERLRNAQNTAHHELLKKAIEEMDSSNYESPS
jgi:hypothetical protein